MSSLNSCPLSPGPPDVADGISSIAVVVTDVCSSSSSTSQKYIHSLFLSLLHIHKLAPRFDLLALAANSLLLAA